MDETVKDSRFSHVAKDPRFRKMQKNHRKVKIDKRFQSMFQDQKFKMKYSVDKRGRPVDTSTNENLKKYYELSSDESEASSGDELENETKSEEETNLKVPKKSRVEVKVSANTKKEIVMDDSMKSRTSKKSTIENLEKKDMVKSHKNTEMSSDNSRDVEDAASSEAESETGSEVSESDKDVEQVADETESEDSSDSEDEGIGPDYARGEGLIESSSEEESEEEEEEKPEQKEEIEHAWGELDKETDLTQEVTSRLAVCNMDWDRIKSQDIMVLLNSFKPAGGTLKSVHIYPSEFGLKRMAEENQKGPTEIIEQKEREGSKHEEFQREKLREYQLKRLKYYYAVVQCDSTDTANHVYEQCDGLEYESTSNRLDLRFIPEDMEFDEEPKSVATDVLNVDLYKPKNYVTSALQQSKVQCTWDETDHDRLAVTMRKFDKDELEEMDLKDYIASDCDDEPAQYGSLELEEEVVGEGSESEEEQVNKYRRLLQDISDKGRKEEQDIDMQISWEPGLKVNTEKLVKKAQEDLTPWESYLEKKKEKRRNKREKKKLVDVDQKDVHELVAENSDSDVPEGIDLNDPYFKEEMDKMDKIDKKEKKQSQKQKGKNKKKKTKLSSEENKEREEREAELNLLLMDEDDQRQHFNLKQLISEDTETMSKSKRKKLKRKKQQQEEEQVQQQQDNFELKVDDPRFKELFENPHYNIDPSAPEFKKTKAVDLLIGEKQKRAKATKKPGKFHDSDSGSSSKKQKREHETETSDTTQTKQTSSVVKEKTKSTEDLARLIKSVKAKAQVLEKKKKRKL